MMRELTGFTLLIFGITGVVVSALDRSGADFWVMLSLGLVAIFAGYRVLHGRGNGS
jgi:uncharacterized membrane protein HdeD (DUF308 family)